MGAGAGAQGRSAELAPKLKQEFAGFDAEKTGTISQDKLKQVLVNVFPDFTEKDLDRLMVAAAQRDGVLVKYEDLIAFLTSTVAPIPGIRLPDGMDSDSKVARTVDAVSQLVSVKETDWRTQKARLNEIIEYIDCHANPAGFKMCQNAALAAGVVGAALNLVEQAGSQQENDAVRSLAWEALARLIFGNEKTAQTVAEAPDLVSTATTALNNAIPPEKLSVLQFIQALSVANCKEIDDIVPQMLSPVVQLLTDADFPSLSEAAFDVIVTCSFRHPKSVVDAMGWERIAEYVASSDARPTWMGSGPLQTLLRGRFGTHVLTQLAPADEASMLARKKIEDGLQNGPFLSYVVECLDAAVSRREWPLGSEAYHSVGRSAELVIRLAALGHDRALVGAIEPLTKAVEIVPDEQATKSALLALHALAADVECFHVLLAKDAWRKDTLEMLHKSGDEVEATELASYLDTVELALQRANGIREDSKSFMKHAPSVQELAELFTKEAKLDKDITIDQALATCARIPLGPSTDLRIALRKENSLSFQAFADRVYGTPTMCGWWPSLMEDLVVDLQEASHVKCLPTLSTLLHAFESASAGKTAIGAETILEKVLGDLGLPTEGLVVEGELSALRGDELDFKAFVRWMKQLCTILHDTEREEAAVVEEEQA